MRRSPLAGWLAACCLLLQLPATPARGEPELPAPATRWLELRTAELVVVSDAGPATAREVAATLATVQELLASLLAGPRQPIPIPTRVFVFARESSFAPYRLAGRQAGEELVGYFLSQPLGNFLALNARPPEGDPLAVARHEYTHLFVRHQWPELPLWANEGLAELASSLLARGDELALGQGIERHLRRLREGGWMPLAELFAVTTESPVYTQTNRSALFYAQSWLLVHELLVQPPGRRLEAVDLFRRLSSGEPAATAVPAALGSSLADLEARLRARAGRAGLAALTLPASAASRHPPPTADLAYEVALCHLGDLLLAERQSAEQVQPQRLRAAEAHFRLAARRAQELGEAWGGLAEVALARGQSQEGKRLARQALALGSRRAETRVVLADLLLAELNERPALVRAGSQRERSLLEARRLLAEALAVAPNFAEAEAALGRSYVLGAGDPTPGIAHLERARELLPERDDVVFNEAMLWVRAGDLARASALVEGELAGRGRSDLVAQAREVLATARQATENAAAQGLARQNEELAAAVALADRGLVLAALQRLRHLLAEPLPDELRWRAEKLAEDLDRLR